MPMRTYSSGMQGRLAFSVAVTMEPDILVIDEALSAGDARFKKKASAKMQQLCSQDTTVVLVTHGMGTVKKLCDRAVWLHKGEVVMKDRSKEVVKYYTRFLEVNEYDELTAEEL